MIETWKPVPGFEHYLVSDAGRIKSLLKSKMTPPNHILKMHRVGAGYLGLSLYKDGKKYDRYIHRLVMLAFRGIPNDLQVNHIDANKENNRLDNLEYCTPKQNVGHAWNLKLMPGPPVMRGSKNPRTKITELLAMDILRLAEGGMGNTAIAEKLLLRRTTVENVVYRRCWKYLTLPPQAAGQPPVALTPPHDPAGKA